MIGEELGLLGALVVLALFGVIIVRGLRLTAKIEEPFDQYLAFGLTVLLGLQALIHMGVVMGLDADEGPGVAVHQLRRIGHGDQLDGGGNIAGTVAPETVAMRVIFAGGGTGGHLFPGLAVAREFQRRDSMTEILFVGTEQGIEYRVLPKEGFRLGNDTGERTQGQRHSRRARCALRRAREPAAFVDDHPRFSSGLHHRSGRLCLRAGATRGEVGGIRCAIMEQNLRPGFTNKLLARFVDRVFTAYRESAAYFSGARVVETGNPVRWQKLPAVAKRAKFSAVGFRRQRRRAPDQFRCGRSAETTDGSQGRAVHHAQTGQADFAAIKAAYESLPFAAEVTPFIDKWMRRTRRRIWSFVAPARPPWRSLRLSAKRRYWCPILTRFTTISAATRRRFTRSRRRRDDFGSGIERRNFGGTNSGLSFRSANGSSKWRRRPVAWGGPKPRHESSMSVTLLCEDNVRTVTGIPCCKKSTRFISLASAASA